MRAFHEPLPQLRITHHNARQTRGYTLQLRCRAFKQCMHGKSRKRRLFRWLPHNRVAANKRKCGVPRPHSDGEVEGRNHAHDAERMPRLHHAMVLPLGSDGEACQLAGKSSSKDADVDHLLHFAVAFGQEFACLDGDQSPQRGEIRPQLFAQQPDQFTTARRGRGAPGEKGCL